MNITKFSDIPSSFRTYLHGRPNRGIIWCDCCHQDLGYLGDNEKPPIVKGFAEHNGKIFKIFECPSCFEVQYHHASFQTIEAFFDLLESMDANKVLQRDQNRAEQISMLS